MKDFPTELTFPNVIFKLMQSFGEKLAKFQSSYQHGN